MSYSLNYFRGDYKAIDYLKWNDVSKRFESKTLGSELMAGRYDLYNGNISSMVTTLSKIDTIVPSGLAAVPVAVPQGNAYKYDQLNRITESKTFCNIDIPNNQWLSSDQFITNMYTNNFTYEANGNILTQTRYDNLGVQHDDMVYKYWKDASGDMIHNRLYHVNDNTGYTSLRSDDIDDQGSFSNHEDSINVYNNYSYDAIGNLVKDSTEEIDSIEWTVYGKIKRITRVTGSTKDNLAFDYDASGNRIAKHILDNSNQWKRTTYYVRDAQGNVMSTYEHTVDDTVLSYAQTEKHLYGSSRLGMNAQPNELIGATASISGDPLTHYQGFKRYELSNHLGNVMTTLTDHKIAVDTNSNDTIDFYLADIMSQYDYYPFGSYMPGRSYNSNSYRYGAAGGQEKDDEITGNVGTHYTAEYWEYDARLGRRWNVDPMFKEKPWMSPYHAFSNKPILNIDPNGANDDEYNAVYNDKTGQYDKTKVSDMGGKDVDFTHYKGGEKDGKTEIVNAKTGESQLMKSSKNVEGYTRRDDKTNWATLYAEYKTGTGPEKSLMYQNHPMNTELIKAPNFVQALAEYIESGETKFGTAPFFNPVSAGTNMTAQFVGKANYNFYEVGDKTVIIVIDSKSITSETFNPITKNNEGNNKPRQAGKVIPESTTHQTYLFIVPTSIIKK
ncbi:MAG: hypothetical protein J0L87_06155 [Bacteroidetes bacterium]|nr:hypothetical protein [Bacteroidota bacterium]